MRPSARSRRENIAPIRSTSTESRGFHTRLTDNVPPPAILDPHTLLFAVSLLGFLAASLTLSLARAAAQPRAAVIEWSRGMSCVGAAVLLLFFRAHLPGFFAYVVANALVLAFPIFALRAYERTFRDARRHDSLRTLYGLQLSGLLVYHLLQTPRELAVVVLCTMLTLEFLLLTRVIANGARDAGPSIRWTAAGTMALLALLFAIRVVATLAGASPSIDPSAQSTVQITTLLAASAVLVGSTVSFVLIVHEQQHRTTLEAMRRDEVTGLLTRKAFFDELAAAANGNRPFALVMVDIDHFKRINDRHGHLAGDMVLAAVGALILGSIRGQDTAGRYGGEEFCVLLRDCSETEAETFCERLVGAAAQQRVAIASGAEVRFTLSAGCAERRGDAIADLLGRTDAALYAAKRAGRNRAVAASNGRFGATVEVLFPIDDAAATIPV